MVLKSIIGATCTCLAVVSFSADAALVSRLSGQAYYDTEADLTWLADANAAGTTMTWADANSWAAGLVVDGNDNWRLATTDPVSFGFNQTGSEMGNLFYNVLGGTAGSSITTSHNSNYDLFSNVQPNGYWSATEYVRFDNSEAMVFGMGSGYQGVGNKIDGYYAWAVQSGDVSAVPVPAAIWLFGSGLIGLAGFARRKKA